MLSVFLTPFVIAGGADGAIAHPDCADQFVIQARVPNSDRPWRSIRIHAAQEKIAACIDRKISKPPEFSRGQIDCESLRHSPQIQNQRSQQRDRSMFAIDADITVGYVAIALQSALDNLSRTVLTVVTAS